MSINTAAAMPGGDLPGVRKVAYEEDLMDLSLPTRDMTDGELEQRVTSALARIDRCEELIARLGTLSTAHRYILGAALEIQKERHEATQAVLPKEWRTPWHKARDPRIKKHVDDDCRALFRNAPSFEEAKNLPWPLAKKKWVRTGFSSRVGGNAVETPNDERVREADGVDKVATRTGEEQGHAPGGARSEIGTPPQDGASLEGEAQLGSGTAAGRENGEARDETRSNNPEGTTVAARSYEEYVRELKSQLPGYQHRIHPTLSPYLADSSYSTFQFGRIGDRYHLVVNVAGEPKWVFLSIPKDAIYDLFFSIRDVEGL